jgi:hypothetical protein
MRRFRTFLKAVVIYVLFSLAGEAAWAQDKGTPLAGHAERLYKKAKDGHFYKDAMKLSPEIRPTSDGKSFVAIWRPKKEPMLWVVDLHGTQGFATDVLALWQPIVKPYDVVGFVSLQWWLGDNANAYYTPEQIYHEIDVVLQTLHVQPGKAMLHAFSRGSSNSYAVAALDAGRGRDYFSLIVADSGGPQLTYPPTRAIVDGVYGPRPLAGTRWITSAGATDPHPDRDGISGMRQAADWLKKQGATVLASIEDPKGGHGALQHNSASTKKVMDAFLGR